MREELLVSEQFGPTFQGEGSSAGRVCCFLRLGACNLHCSWCDTPYTWDWTGRNGVKYDPKVELTRMTFEEITAQFKTLGLFNLRVPMLVVSGGEPLLQQKALAEYLNTLSSAVRVEVETAGTITPSRELVTRVTQFNCSPKLENSGNEKTKRYNPEALDILQDTHKTCWKFVVTSDDDLAEVKYLVTKHDLHPVYIMPEGIDVEALQEHMQAVAKSVLLEGWNLSPRLQVEIFGNTRGT